jgi:hypothetical protein
LQVNPLDKERTMAKLTRRGFFRETTVSAATVGAMASIPGLTMFLDSPEDPVTEISPGAFVGPLVAHIRDAGTGEISLLVGTRELMFRDTDLVARLVKAAL